MFLGLLSWACQAAVYRWVDAEGTPHFSDQPHAGAQEIEVPPLPTVPALRPPPPPAPPQAATPVYKHFEVISPTTEQAVRANNGRVSVRLALSPSLRPGDRISLVLDGKPLPGASHTLTFELSNLARGGHTVQGSIVDANGRAVISTTPVTFYVLRVRLPQPAAPK